MSISHPHEIHLPTDPPMTVTDVWDRADGLYMCVKNHNSEFLWVNDNFARLIGVPKEELIGKRDTQEAHVRHDKEVMKSGKPLLNLRETIEVPDRRGGTMRVPIITQKGLLREKGGTRIIGITVCFALEFPEQDSAALDRGHAMKERIRQLRLEHIDLGGYFAPGHASGEVTAGHALPDRFEGDRGHYSSNYYLLPEGEVLKLHRLNQDEVWYFHEGSPIRLHVFPDEGEYRSVLIGNHPEEALQANAPHGCWFGAELVAPGYALASCSLAPAWDSRDSKVPSHDDLAALERRFPEQSAILEHLTRKH
jgi:hypothetical protein